MDLEPARSGRRWGRIIAAGSAAAVVVAVVVTAVIVAGSSDSGRASEHVAAQPSGQAAIGCGPLRPRLAGAATDGRSLIEAYGRLTGQTSSEGGTPYRQMALTRVRTLSGAAVPPTLLGWLPTTPDPAPAAAAAPGLWGPDGHLIAIVTPGALANTSVGPILSVAPVVGDDVVLNPIGCWSDPTLKTTPFTGSLQEIPGSGAYHLAEQSGGFGAYPLSSLVKLTTS